MELKRIEVRKTARYAILKPEGEVKAVLYALHGYRQLVSYFIASFQVLADQGVMVIAPEGLNRFYVEGYSGQVGATWMTKEDREDDIQDYLAYLDQLHADVFSKWSHLPFHLLGFSQGGATASRWLSHSEANFESFTLYASVFPNDFDFPAMKSRLDGMALTICFGDQDRFADEATIAKKMDWLKSYNYAPELLRFEGQHKIYPEVLKQLWKGIKTA